MISRSSALAAVFAVLATSTLAVAANTSISRQAELRDRPVVQLPTVEVTYKRSAALAPAAPQR
jgi:hypothetical protein